METDGSTEGTAASDPTCLPAPSAQDPGVVGEAGKSGGQGASAGPPGDPGLGEEGAPEGRGEILAEKPFSEAGLQEAEQAAVGGVVGNLPSKTAGTPVPEDPAVLPGGSGRRTPLGGPLCGQEPGQEEAMEISPEAAMPWETHGGRDASQDRVPENEVDTERLPHRDTGQLAAGCPLGPRDPEEESGIVGDASLSQLSFAKVERETMGPGMTEAGEERTTAVLQHYGHGINTSMAKEMLLQEFSVASASDSPAHEVNPEGECSGEGEGAVAAVVACGERQENSSSEDLLETCKEALPWAAAAPPAGLILGAGMEADLREQPKDLEGTCTEEGLSQRREACPAGGQEGVAAEGELGHGRTRWTELGLAAEGLCGHEEGRPEGEGVATSPASAALAPSPGGEEPDSACGRERKGQEEAGGGGASGGEEWEAQSGGSLAAGEGRLEDLPDRLLEKAPGAPQESCSNTGGALAGSLGGGVVGGHAGLLPPLQLSSSTLGGGEGTPPSEDLCAGRSGKGAGGRGGSGKSRLWPEQDDLSREVHAGPWSSSVGTLQQRHQRAEPEGEGERWADCPVGCGAPSALAAQAGCLAGAAVGQAPREPESPGAEPQGLGKSPEVEPRGADAGQGPFSPAGLPAEGGAWEEGCPADGAMESSTSPGPEGRGAAVVGPPEQGSPLQQSPGGSSCRGEQGQVSLGLCAAGSEQPGALLGSTAPCPPRQSQAGPSRGFPECSSSDELSLRISDSEAEREESEDSRAPGPSGRGLLLLPKKEAFIPDSVEHLGGVMEDRAVCGQGAEWGATQGQGEAARQEPGGGPLRATDTLTQQSPSCREPCSDLSRAAVAAPETSAADVAPGGKSPPVGAAAAAREGREAPAAGGTALLPLSPPRASDEEEPHLFGSDAKLDIEDQAPTGTSGAAEEVGSDLSEDGGQVGRGSAGQPGRGSPEAGEASEGRLQREIPAGACAGREERAQKAKGKAPFCLQQGLGAWQPQEDRSQPAGGSVGSKWSVSPGRGRSPFPKEEEPDGCSSRKRQSSKGQEALGVGDSEEDPCSQKRLRLLGSGPDLHSPTRLLSAPLDLERHRDQFSRTIGKFLQRYSSQTTLPSAEAEEKSRDSIAQIVRTYFNGTFGPEGGPEAENLDVEMALLPLEAGMSEGVDCSPPAAGSEAEGSAAHEEAESSLPLSAGARVSPVKSQDLSFCSECSSPSSPCHSSGSQTQQWGQELAAHAPESAWEAYVSEEEEFQSSISSALERSLLNSSLASPEARCGQGPCEKSVDLVFSDASNGSAEPDHSEPPPDPGLRSSRGVGSGQLSGVLSEAEEVDLASGGAFRSPEPAGMDWWKEETSTLPGRRVSSHERPPTPEADVPVAPGDHLGAVGEKAAAPVLRQAGGPFHGEGDQEAPSKKASERVTSCVSSLVGEAREELDNGPDEMQIEGGPFLQGSHKEAPSQGNVWWCM